MHQQAWKLVRLSGEEPAPYPDTGQESRGEGMGSGLRRNDGGEAFTSSLRRPPESRGVGDGG